MVKGPTTRVEAPLLAQGTAILLQTAQAGCSPTARCFLGDPAPRRSLTKRSTSPPRGPASRRRRKMAARSSQRSTLVALTLVAVPAGLFAQSPTALNGVMPLTCACPHPAPALWPLSFSRWTHAWLVAGAASRVALGDVAPCAPAWATAS